MLCASLLQSAVSRSPRIVWFSGLQLLLGTYHIQERKGMVFCGTMTCAECSQHIVY